MARTVEGQEFVNATEASHIVGGSRDRFYKNVKPYLRPYHFGARKAPWYNKKEVIALASGKPLRHATIPITGMFTDWTSYARSLGLNAQTTNRDIEIGPLPEDIASAFDLPSDELFVKRGRMTFVEDQGLSTPICSWDTYYPARLVGDILTELQQGTARNIVEHIAERHGLIIGKAKDRYSARITTFEEQNLFHLLNDEPVLILQRVSSTRDGETLILFSNMVLLGSWFVITREEEVHNWDK